MRTNGYSLVELMVVVVLVGVLGTAMVGLFLSTMRSGGKSTTISRIKSEGDYALSTMERLIRSGTNAECTSTDSLTIDELSDSPAQPTSIYSLDTSRLKIESGVSLSDVRYLTSNNVIVSGLEFVCVDGANNTGDIVTIKFTMMSTADTVTTETFISRVVLRNSSR